MTHLLFFITLLTVLLALLPPPQEKSRFRVDVQRAIRELLEDEDTDSDLKITIADRQIDSTPRGDKTHVVVDIEGKKHKITGTYYLSNLLEELSLARDSGMSTLEIDPARIYEPPARRISRMIREQFWNNLTRRIDEQNLTRILADQKTTSTDGSNYLYVAPDDSMAISYFNSVALKDTALRLRVVVLPHQVDGSYVGSLAGKHGLLALALGQDSGGSLSGVPFVVPGGRFNEMYGWDSYFEALGLLQDGRIDLARAMVDNLVYEINHYGKILNANRTYYLTRSQPPFLTSMMRAVYERLPRNAESLKWLEMVLRAAIREYRDVWRGRDRLTETGLSRYFDSGTGPPPEVEPGHFDHVFTRFARMRKMDPGQFERDYRSGKISVPELDRYFKHDRAMRESGHDSSYRLEGVCADLVTVDLNSLLYKIEVDVAEILEKEV